MNGKTLFGIAFLAVFTLLANFASAGLELQSYSVTPSVLQPGGKGAIVLTLVNTQGDFVSSASLHGTSAFGDYDVPIGDLSTQGTVFSIPFTVPKDTLPGVYEYRINAYYSVGVTSQSAKSKTFSVPITVNELPLLQVSSSAVNSGKARAGESFGLTVTVENKGGVAKSLSVSSASQSFNTIPSKIGFGDVEKGNAVGYDASFSASSSASAGNYFIPLNVSYFDALGNARSEVQSIGPISVAAASEDLRVSVSASQAFPGSKAQVVVKLRNVASSEISNLRVSMQSNTSVFVTLSGDQEIQSLAPGEEKEVSFNTGVNINAPPAYYPVQVTVNYDSREAGSKTVSKVSGVSVEAKSMISLIATTNPSPLVPSKSISSISIQFSNSGNTPVRALSASVSSNAFDFVSSNEYYVGTLALDDYATGQFSVVLKDGTQPGTYPVKVKVFYKDSFNAEHTEEKTLEIRVFPQGFGQAQKQDNTLLLLVALVAVGGGYLAYNRFKKKKAQ